MRSPKLGILLIVLSILIMIVSGAVYNYMYMKASPISPDAATLQFVSAADSTAAGFATGANGTYATFNGLGGWPNATRTYQAACGIQNTDTSSIDFELKFDQAGDWSGDTGQVNSITVIVRDSAGGTQQGTTINVGTPGSGTGTITLPASTTWVVEWNITWNAGAQTSHQVDVTLSLVTVG